ncbi:MAG: choice-of-anchor Q domain-containing protein, partial [Planctomycetaceae bacterium]|nr:choice-of-anchor Q domain-containing protein [Planctomycetaceae bacterium]
MTRHPFLGILLAIVVCTAAQPIHAATIAVTTTTDELNPDGDCSLREAVRAANANVTVDACPAGENNQTDTITVPAGTYTLTVVGNDNDGTAGDLDILDNTVVDDLVISGAGAATTIIQACAVEQLSGDCPAGQGVADRVLYVRDAHVAISGVTIRHGRAPSQNQTRTGSGIWMQQASTLPALTLTDVVVTKNGDAVGDIASSGGGIANWAGPLTLTRVTISDNQATSGGGILNQSSDAVLVMTDSIVSGNTALGGGGGGIRNESNAAATFTNSTISGNRTGSGGGAGNTYTNSGAGLYNITATATLTGCTVSDNVAANRGGGIVNVQLNVSQPAVMTLTNTTISGNRTENGGPAAFLNSDATATLTNCTISGNQAADTAGGIYTFRGTMNLRSCTITANRLLEPSHGAGGLWASGPMVFRNTIVAGNFHDDPNPAVNAPDCFSGSFEFPVSEGYSLFGHAYNCPGLHDGANGDQIGTKAAPIDAMLGPLADHGGPTLTHLWLPGSPAIDAGNPAPPGSGGTACPTTDQRGEPRPRGVACDIGAVELEDTGVLTVEAVKPEVGGNGGTVSVRIFGRSFDADAEVRLVRPGFPDVVGTGVGADGSVLSASLDLHGVAPGLWSVRVQNPDASTATLSDAFTVEAGGGADLWVELVLPRGIFAGRTQSIYLAFGNRGTVDAYGVPLWFTIPEELTFHIPFPVSPPPSQPEQFPADWTRIAIDEPIPPPEDRDSFALLLPVVPAGSTGMLRFRVTGPPSLDVVDASRLPFRVTAAIGTPYFQPNLAEEAVATFVARAKELAADDLATPGVPSDEAIAAYVRTQLAGVVANGIANPDLGGSPTVFSQSQLVVDTAYFMVVASDPAHAARESARHLFARVYESFVGRSAEARIVDPDCPPGDIFCERDDEEFKPCPFGILCCPLPGTLCFKKIPPSRPPCGRVQVNHLDWYDVPCKPEPKDPEIPFLPPVDPNDKVGPGGPGGFIDGLTPLPYTINFENKATAAGEAFEVSVTDQLDVTKYDLATFSLGPISFGDRLVPVPPGLQSFSTEVDLRPGVNILVGIDAKLDTATGLVTWKFATLDPATHQFPEEPEFGFLPPNVTPPEGEGAVLFTVSLKPGFGLGTTVCNDARIVFDFNAPIDTPTFCNTVGEPEDCENCIDDDGDTFVDRADPDCTAAPNGAGAGAGDATVGKTIDKCGKTVRKVGAKLLGNRLKQLGACEKVVADCVQLKPGDAACLAKAQAKCTKAR